MEKIYNMEWYGMVHGNFNFISEMMLYPMVYKPKHTVDKISINISLNIINLSYNLRNNLLKERLTSPTPL